MSSPRKPSSGYLITLALGAIGLTLSVIAVDAQRLFLIGGEPADALNHSGVVAMVLSYSVLFIYRLIFSKNITVDRQDLIRDIVQLYMILLVIFTMAAGLYVFSQTIRPFLSTWFMAFALLSQISSIVWLVKYRRE